MTLNIDQRISTLVAKAQSLIDQLAALNTVALDLRQQVGDLEQAPQPDFGSRTFHCSYGFCPTCGSPGVSRERRPSGNDRCSNGHTYPSSTALASPNNLEQTGAGWAEPKLPDDIRVNNPPLPEDLPRHHDYPKRCSVCKLAPIHKNNTTGVCPDCTSHVS